MVVDGSAGNAVDLVSLDTSMSVPICLKNLTDAAQLYGGCLTSRCCCTMAGQTICGEPVGTKST